MAVEPSLVATPLHFPMGMDLGKLAPYISPYSASVARNNELLCWSGYHGIGRGSL